MADFPALDRLVRTEVPTLCRAVGLNLDATDLETREQVDRLGRLASASLAMRDFEDRILTSWDTAWDARWDPRLFRSQLVSARELNNFIGATNEEKLLFKTSLRVAELLMAWAG